MGHIADTVLKGGGEVTGVIPKFMSTEEFEWQHDGLTTLHEVEDLHKRKKKFWDGTDAVVALPGVRFC